MNKSNKWLKILLTTSLVMGTYACSESKTVEEYQAEAEKFIEQKDFKSALIALKNANAADTENPYLRFELGQLYLNEGDYKSAEKELSRAEFLGYAPEKVLPKLAEVKFKLNQYAEVYEYAELAKALPDDGFIIVNTYAGLSSLHQGEYEQAQQYISAASEIQSDSLYGVLGKGYLAVSENEAKSALKNINDVIAKHPEFYEGVLLKAYLLQNLKEHQLAAEAFEAYKVLQPKDVSALFFIAQNYISAGFPEKAEPLISSILKISPHNALGNQMKAQVEFGKKNYAVAQEFALKAYQQNEGLVNATLIAGMSAYYLDKHETAYQHLLKAKTRLPDGHFIDKLLIELQLKLGYDDAAFEDITKLIDSGDANNSMLLAASQELLKTGNKGAAQELLNESLKLETVDPAQLTQQGLLKLQLSDLGAGVDLLEKSYALDPESERTESALAIGYLTNNQLEKALDIAKGWQQQTDKKVQGLLFESSILQKQENHPAASNLLQQVLKLEPSNTTALYQLALYALKSKNYKEGYLYLTKVLSQNPKHTRAMQGLLTLISEQKNFADKAESFYQDEITLAPENNALKLGLSYVYSYQNKNKQALNILTEIQNSKDPVNGIELIIGDIHSKQGNLVEAIKNYRKFVTSAPSNINGLGKLITAYESSNDLSSALDTVEQGLTRFPKNLGLQLLKVSYQSRLNKNVDTALLTELSNNPQSMNHFLLKSTLGNIAFSKGALVEAHKFFKESYQLVPSSLNVIQLSRVVGRIESVDNAINILKEHLNSVNANSPRVQAVLANAYLQKDNFSMANLIYRDLLESNPTNSLALNNLAYISIQLNEAEQALNYAEKAIQNAPNVAEVIDTYGQSLAFNKQFKLAIKQFDKAISLKPNVAEFKINKAKTLIKIGNNSEAKVTLESIKKASDSEKAVINALYNNL